MKKHIILGLLLVSALPARAQYTTVTATVIDPNSVPYAGCRGEADFVPSPSATLVPTLSGSTFQTSVIISACDSFGTFSLILADNAQVTDGHTSSPASKWNFSISSQNGKTSFTCTLTITGATQNISAAIQACAAPFPASVATAASLLGPGTISGTFSGTPTQTGLWTFGAGIVTTTETASGLITANGGITSAGPNIWNGTTTASLLNGDLFITSAGAYQSMAACYAALSATGQACHVPAGWAETFSSNLVMSKPNAGFIFHGPATITMGTNQVLIGTTAGLAGPFIIGYSPQGAIQSSGGVYSATGGVQFIYTGTGTAFVAGGSSATPVVGMKLENFSIDLRGAGSAAIGLNLKNVEGGGRIGHSVDVIGPGGAITQIALQIDDGGNFSGDFTVEDFQAFGVKTGVLLNGSTEEVTFIGTIISTLGTAGIGIDFEGGALCSANNFYGGVSNPGVGTAVKFGGSSQSNRVEMAMQGSPNTSIAFGASATSNFAVYQGTATPVITDASNGSNIAMQGSTVLAGRLTIGSSASFVNAENRTYGAPLVFGCTGALSAGTSNFLTNGGVCALGAGYDIPMDAAQYQNMRCFANAGGVNGSDGVVTVRKNGSLQTITATFGTGTSVTDVAHSFTTVTGDRIGIQVVTQGGTTLSGITCSLERL